MVNLNELVALSRGYGAKPELVLAGGGNTSAKDGEFLYIKGSGAVLATIGAADFVKMKRRGLAGFFDREYPSAPDAREAAVLADILAARAEGEEDKRPSVETLLHNLFPQVYVVHTHPALVNGLTCAARGREHFRRLFGDRAVWIDSIQPGYTLAKSVASALDAYREARGRDANILFLQNHGIFVSGNTPAEIDGAYADILSVLKSEQGNAYGEIPPIEDFDAPPDGKAREIQGRLETLLDGQTVLFTSNAWIKGFLDSEASFRPASSVYTPDHMVYYGRAPLFVADRRDGTGPRPPIETAIRDFVSENGFSPKVIAVEKLGFYSIGDSPKAAETVRQLFLDTLKIATYSRVFGGPLFMTDELIDFIGSWEAETYRKKLSDGGKSPATP
jgi:rhamnose utilization protein RhaD (predicted bifunctional aldolase and dehydrogenase)